MVSREEDAVSLELADRALGFALAAGAAEAEAVVMREDGALTRFANSEIHQNVAQREVAVNLRVVIGKRVGVASSGRSDDEGLRTLAAKAVAIARVVEELPDWGGLAEPRPLETATDGFEADTAAATPGVPCRRGPPGHRRRGCRRRHGLRLVLDRHRHHGRRQLQWGPRRRLADHGAPDHRVDGRSGGTGYAEAAAVDATTIDPGAIGREAAEKARASANAVAIEHGDYPVVLEEYAVVDLLDMLGYLGFSALAVQEERSFFEPGKRIGSDLVTIRDDGADPAGLPMAFDYEGLPKQRVELVERGTCRDVVYDVQTAARDGVASTGHGLPAPNPYGPFPLNMVMEPGNATRDELIGGLDRGLLVTRFHYTNPVHPKLAIVTGMTRDGTFLVEGGRIVGPVRNLRYTQSYLDALRGAVAVGRERRTLKGFLGGVAVPAVRIENWTFTGTTEH